MNSHVNR